LSPRHLNAHTIHCVVLSNKVWFHNTTWYYHIVLDKNYKNTKEKNIALSKALFWPKFGRKTVILYIFFVHRLLVLIIINCER
jgi:hypothetical protein